MEQNISEINVSGLLSLSLGQFLGGTITGSTNSLAGKGLNPGEFPSTTYRENVYSDERRRLREVLQTLHDYNLA